MPCARISSFAHPNKIRQVYVCHLDVGNGPTSSSRKLYLHLFSQSSLKSVRTLSINNFLKISSRLHDNLKYKWQNWMLENCPKHFIPTFICGATITNRHDCGHVFTHSLLTLKPISLLVLFQCWGFPKLCYCFM